MHLVRQMRKADRSKLPSDPINGLPSYEIAPVARVVGNQKFHPGLACLSVIPITQGKGISKLRLQVPIYAGGKSLIEARRARVAPGEKLGAHPFSL